MPDAEDIQNEEPETSDSENQGEGNLQQAEGAIEITPCTDLGNAERLVDKHGHEIRYCPETKDWYFYQGVRWVADKGLYMNGAAYQVSRDILEESRNERLPSKTSDELLRHARKSSSKGGIRAMIDVAKWLPRVSVSVGMFDGDPMLLNCINGTLDLRNGVIRGHDPADLITKMVPVPYDPQATCAVWETFVDRIMESDRSRVEFLQRAVGYSLTGITSEQCLFVLHGPGANGKSTLMETIRELLADYAMHTTTSSLLQSKSSPIRNDLARLNGARCVSAVEIGMGKRLDEALVKQLTGGDQVTARFLYNEYFEYKPTFKLFIAANHKPDIRGVDHGIWRRIHLIPFNVTIPSDEIDRDLPSKLRAELPGILAWAVRGCREWQEHGLMVPESIAVATSQYRAEMDVSAEFLNDRCILQAGEKEPLKTLYDAYREWCDSACQDAVGKKVFGNLMKQKGFSQSKSGGVRYWSGLKLNDDN